MIEKNLCLINKAVYPRDFSSHKQNLDTFNGWLETINHLHVISQTHTKKTVFSDLGKITSALLPKRESRIFNLLTFYILGALELHKTNKRKNFFAFQASDPAAAVLSYYASEIYNKIFIFEIQGDILNLPSKSEGFFFSRIVKFVSTYLINRAHFVRVVSPFLKKQLIESFHIKPEKIFVVPPRCNKRIFKYDRIPKNKPKVFDFPSNNILFIGNISKAKGVEVLIKAFLEIEPKINIRLILIGDGPHISYFKSLLVNKVNKKIIFLGKINYELIPDYLYFSDVLVLPSYHEGFGRVLIEAMAMKKPVIGSKTGGIKDIIDDRINGLLFDVGNHKELSNLIEKIIKDSRFANTLAENGYKNYMRNFEYSVSMKKFISMYKEIIKSTV